MTGIRCIPCTPCSAADSCSPAGAKIKPRYLCMKAGESRLRAGSDVDVTTMMARGAGRVGDVMMRSYRSRQKTLMCVCCAAGQCVACCPGAVLLGATAWHRWLFVVWTHQRPHQHTQRHALVCMKPSVVSSNQLAAVCLHPQLHPVLVPS